MPVGGANAAEPQASASVPGLSAGDFTVGIFGWSPPHRSPFSFGGEHALAMIQSDLTVVPCVLCGLFFLFLPQRTQRAQRAEGFSAVA
jgi:hypothetical protein